MDAMHDQDFCFPSFQCPVNLPGLMESFGIGGGGGGGGLLHVEQNESILISYFQMLVVAQKI